MKCLAIDDEPLALAQLSDYISRVPFLSLVKPCQDAFEAMKVLSDEGDFHYRLFRICGGRLQVGCGGLSVETI